MILTYDDAKSLTATKLKSGDLQPGDYFHEMYSYFIVILAHTGDTVEVFEGYPGNPQAIVERGERKTLSLDALHTHLQYSTGNGYWVLYGGCSHAYLHQIRLYQPYMGQGRVGFQPVQATDGSWMVAVFFLPQAALCSHAPDLVADRARVLAVYDLDRNLLDGFPEHYLELDPIRYWYQRWGLGPKTLIVGMQIETPDMVFHRSYEDARTQAAIATEKEWHRAGPVQPMDYPI